MPLTFSQAITKFGPRTPTGSTAEYLNRALERLLSVGGARGLTEKSTFTVYSTGQTNDEVTIPAETLVLPLKYSTILGCIIRGVQTGVAAEWYPYQPGAVIDSAGLPAHPITDLGFSLETGQRSYHVPMTNGDSSVSVTARCRIQHVELTSESDDDVILPITNISALGLAIDAQVFEAAGDIDNAIKSFNRAIALLREERVESEPDVRAQSPVRVVFTGEDTMGATSFY